MEQQPEFRLAFKCVRENYESIWVTGSFLSKTYEVGQSYETHSKLPMYIISGLCGENSWDTSADYWGNRACCFGAGASWDRLLLVKLPTNTMTRNLPFISSYILDIITTDVEAIKRLEQYSSPSNSDWSGSSRLEVLEEVNLDNFKTRQEVVDFYSKKYNLPFVQPTTE